MHHHIPIYKSEHISEGDLESKLTRVGNGAPLKISYAGRVIEMKGPVDWLNAIQSLVERGVEVNATWFGDGHLLPVLRAEAAKRGIGSSAEFPGFVSDRQEVLCKLRESDIFLFCHKSLESARVLGEALACGCPIVGYDSAYASDLVRDQGGGLFAPLGDWPRLAELLYRLDRDRGSLQKLIRQAATSGRLYDRDAAMRNRIGLVKNYLLEPRVLEVHS
jgi:glycosyltransferase involved in cell wall biosynthesis